MLHDFSNGMEKPKRGPRKTQTSPKKTPVDQYDLYGQVTLEVAREAARAINDYMAHWGDNFSEEFKRSLSGPSQLRGAKVVKLKCLLATQIDSSSESPALLWQASFDKEYAQPLLFTIHQGNINRPFTRDFYAEDLAELDAHAEAHDRPLALPGQEVAL